MEVRPPDKTLTLRPGERIAVGSMAVLEAECLESGRIKIRFWTESVHIRRIAKSESFEDTLPNDLSEI